MQNVPMQNVASRFALIAMAYNSGLQHAEQNPTALAYFQFEMNPPMWTHIPVFQVERHPDWQVPGCVYSWAVFKNGEVLEQFVTYGAACNYCADCLNGTLG